MKNNLNHEKSKFEPNKYSLKNEMGLLEASAGTGKTFALAHIVLRLIVEKEIPINKILVVTFTEAAAEEIKGRIYNRLNTAVNIIENYKLEDSKTYNQKNEVDEVLIEWLEKIKDKKIDLKKISILLLEAMESIDQADITTIHGFCHRTITKDTFESLTPVNPIIEVDNKELIYEIVNEYWKEHVIKLPEENLKGLKQKGFTREKLGSLISKIDNDATINFKTNEIVNNEELNLSDKLENVLEKTWEIFKKEWFESSIKLENHLIDKAIKWRKEGVKDTKPFSPKPRKDRISEVNLWISNAETKLNYHKIVSESNLTNYFHPGCLYEITYRTGDKEVNPPLLSLHSAIADLIDKPINIAWKHGLQYGLKRLKEKRNLTGAITFTDLLRSLDPDDLSIGDETANSKRKTSLVNKLKCRYNAAIIDEFQDTDPIQWRILYSIFGKSNKHFFFLIGDPKQAIYSFRGGDLNTYKKAKKLSNKTHMLLDNYRTCKNLMKELNNLLKIGLKESDLSISRLEAKNNIETEDVLGINRFLHVIKFDKVDNNCNMENNKLLTKRDYEELIPTTVTNQILKIINKDNSKIKLSDICIIVGKHEQAKQIRRNLSLAGLPSWLVSKGDVLTSEAGELLQKFIDCLASPSDSAKIRLVATSALVQLTQEDLNNSIKEQFLDNLAKDFSDWSLKLPKIGVIGCLSELLKGEKIADISERGRLLGDLLQCAQLLQEEIHLKGLNSKSAAEWLRAQRLNPPNIINENRQPNSDVVESAINVITVHRSKGLEYKIIICPYLWQSPIDPKGPLWRCSDKGTWEIAINKSWGEGRQLFLEEYNSAFQEAERLAYVAMTRAKCELFIIWACAFNQERNPLINLLFGPSASSLDISNLNIKRMKSWLISNNIDVDLISADIHPTNTIWKNSDSTPNVQTAPIPRRKLDSNWSRSSYSSWIHNQNSAISDLSIYEFKEIEETNQFDIEENTELKHDINNNLKEFYNQIITPLGKFPRGAKAGNCLHKILERVNFELSIYSEESSEIIKDELNRSGYEINLITDLQKGLNQVLNTNLGELIGDIQIKNIKTSNRLKELTFDLSLSQKGNFITAKDISKAFNLNKDHTFSSKYSDLVKSLNINCKGFLTGSIDMIFTNSDNISTEKWWVADWKSNFIGKVNDENKAYECGPHNYTPEALKEQMIKNHYPIQSLIYLVALHRFLSWRLKNYNPYNNLGGYVYIFLRGLPGEINYKNLKSKRKDVPGIFLDSAPVERILYLDKLFREGGE